jgi:hypothetical protein
MFGSDDRKHPGYKEQNRSDPIRAPHVICSRGCADTRQQRAKVE